MKILYLLLLICICFFSVKAIAQPQTFVPSNDILMVGINGDTLHNAWAGGLNSPQFSSIDLNGDAFMDLLVFDKYGNLLIPFLGNPTTGNGIRYIAAPEYRTLFPVSQYYVIARDFDFDGDEDLFSYSVTSASEITVYENQKVGSVPTFTLKSASLTYSSSGFTFPIQATTVELPSILDIDGDQDLDILTVSNASESPALFKNMSQELYSNSDSLNYSLATSCWGEFTESISVCSVFNYDVSCKGGPGGVGLKDSLLPQHGSKTYFFEDLNGDGSYDLLLSDEGCGLFKALNVGSNLVGDINNFTVDFPNSSNPLTEIIYPGIFFEDLDQDGLKDIVAAPNELVNLGNIHNFHNSVFYYRNTGTASAPSYSFQTDHFLQGDMIDLGENSWPIVADFDGDGDEDILVSSKGRLLGQGDFRTSLTLIENTGTSTQPAFKVIDTNYLNFSVPNSLNLSLHTADLTGDGKMDLIFGIESPRFPAGNYYIPNTYSSGSLTSAFSLSDTNQFPGLFFRPSSDMPVWFDGDGDGDLDVFMFKAAMLTSDYYENIGTATNPNFQFNTFNYQGIDCLTDPRLFKGGASDFDGDGKLDLLMSFNPTVRQSKLHIVSDFTSTNPIVYDQVIYDSLLGGVTRSKLSTHSPVGIADLNDDGLLDLVAGSSGGGLLLYMGHQTKAMGQDSLCFADAPTSISAFEKPNSLRLFPNPSDESFTIEVNEDASLTLLDNLGRTMEQQRLKAGSNQIKTNHLPNGIYIVLLEGRIFMQSTKLVVHH